MKEARRTSPASGGEDAIYRTGRHMKESGEINFIDLLQ